MAARSPRSWIFLPCLTRRISIAFSTSPCASVSAFLQSIIPAPVRSRRALTSFAAISTVFMSRSSPLSSRRRSRRPPARAARSRPARPPAAQPPAAPAARRLGLRLGGLRRGLALAFGAFLRPSRAERSARWPAGASRAPPGRVWPTRTRARACAGSAGAGGTGVDSGAGCSAAAAAAARSAAALSSASRLRLFLGLALGLLLGLALGARLGLDAGLLLGFLARALLLGAEHGVALGDDLADRLRDQGAGADRVVVAGDHEVDAVGVAVGVDEADDRDAQALRLFDGDHLGLEVDHEHRVGHALHVLDAAEVRPQLREVGLGGHALARGQQRELALGLVAFEVVQAADALVDRLEVGQQAAEPAVVDVRHVRRLRRRRGSCRAPASWCRRTARCRRGGRASPANSCACASRAAVLSRSMM